MANHTFFCIDGHTCGNPVRLVAGGGPSLRGATMLERRARFLAEFDWVRTALMFEPRGHDLMSGSILYPPLREDCDAAVLFIETSGCLPMCGHGLIGTVTFALERGLVTPREPGRLRIETPGGLVTAEYDQAGAHVERVRITNVASYLHARGLEVHVPGLGRLVADVAYGGNFYAIIEPQAAFPGLDRLSAAEIVRLSPLVRQAFGEAHAFVHPEEPRINGLSHVMWTGPATRPGSTARNAVFYGEAAIDRSPCGTGTSARMAQWAARGQLRQGEAFVHESIIGSQFTGRIVGSAKVGGHPAIIPSIEGWACMTGLNTIFVDDRDPYRKGFQVR